MKSIFTAQDSKLFSSNMPICLASKNNLDLKDFSSSNTGKSKKRLKRNTYSLKEEILKAGYQWTG